MIRWSQSCQTTKGSDDGEGVQSDLACIGGPTTIVGRHFATPYSSLSQLFMYCEGRVQPNVDAALEDVAHHMGEYIIALTMFFRLIEYRVALDLRRGRRSTHCRTRADSSIRARH
jgi:hypothetical protein